MTVNSLNNIIAQYKFLVRESHLDTFGHVNNATYLSLYEEARWERISQNGFGLKDIQTKGIGPVILEVNVKFMKELKLREEIIITTELAKQDGKIGTLKQRMLRLKPGSSLNADGSLNLADEASYSVCSEALFTIAVFDLKTRKLIDPPPEWMKAAGAQA